MDFCDGLCLLKKKFFDDGWKLHHRLNLGTGWVTRTRPGGWMKHWLARIRWAQQSRLWKRCHTHFCSTGLLHVHPSLWRRSQLLPLVSLYSLTNSDSHLHLSSLSFLHADVSVFNAPVWATVDSGWMLQQMLAKPQRFKTAQGHFLLMLYWSRPVGVKVLIILISQGHKRYIQLYITV